MAGRQGLAIWLAVAATLLVVAGRTAAAASIVAPQAPAGITISPSQKDITINPGLITANTAITITNNSGARLIGQLRLLDIDVSQGTGYSFLNPSTGHGADYGLANWMTLPNGDTINIANGQALTIPIRIDNRADLAPGGHYGALVVAFGSPSAAAGAGKADFKQQLASLLFIKKRGGERNGLTLTDIKAVPANSLPTTVVLNFKNTGNVHVAPIGYVTVANPSGKVVAKGIINTDATLLLPGASKLLESRLQLLGTQLDSGRYTVTAYYRYDEQASFATKSIQFSYQRNSNVLIIGTIIAASLALLLVIVYLKQPPKRHS